MGVRTPGWGAMLVCLSAYVLPGSADAATIAVPAGGDLQAALNVALPGDVITLAPGATYVGNFTLPDKGSSTQFITVRSAAADSLLPPPGVRITPAFAGYLPKIKSATSVSALRTKAGAHHWKLMFLEFQANLSGYGEIMALGAADTTQTLLSQVPHDLVLDRVYIHGDPKLGQKRGIALHSSDTTIINSYISDIKAVGQDSQAIGGSNGPGNYLIENNYLEAAAENFLLGGNDPPIVNLVTSNVVFRRNLLSKPLSWRDPIIATPTNVRAAAAPGSGTLGAGTYTYTVVARVAAGQTTKANSSSSAAVSATIAAGATGGVTVSWTPVVGADDYVVYGRVAGGTSMYWKVVDPFFTDTGAAGTAGTAASATKWAVKNSFELKNARDVLAEGNVFENVWVAAQPGYPIVFTPRNQSGNAPWCVVERVTFQNNLIRHTAGGINILGTDDIYPSGTTNNIIIRGNVFDDMNTSWGTGAKGIQIGDGGYAYTIDHNTIDTNVSAIVAVYGGSATSPTQINQFVYTNNMSEHRTYGIWGASMATGLSTINAYMPDSIIRRNVLAGGSASKYPADNFFPTVLAWKADFVDFEGADYHLLSSSVFKNAGTDGVDLGAPIDVVMTQAAAAIAGVPVSSAPGPAPVQITTDSLPNATTGQPYSTTLACSGGASPCAWQLVSATLPAGLSFNAATATLSGTPTLVQTGAMTVTAYDPATPSNSATRSFSVTVDAPTLTLSMPAQPQGQVGVAYSLSPSVTGLVGTATWSVASGALPVGVAIDPSTGVIAGTPSVWGTSNALIQVQDSWGGRTDAEPVSITIAPSPIAVSTTTLGTGTYQQFYQSLLNASGGTGNTSWAIVGGALPNGVNADANGAVSGTPVALGSFSVTFSVTDTAWPANQATATLPMAVVAPSFTASMPPAPGAQLGVAYQLAGSASGAVGAVVWSVVSGALPPGLSLDSATGLISGVPSATGAFTAGVRAQDSWDPSRAVTMSVAIAVTQTASALSVATSSLPNGSIGRVYSAGLTAAGASGPVTWVIKSGSLPQGLSLAPDGTISGTPRKQGTANFTVQATDTGAPANVAVKALSIFISKREVAVAAGQ